MRAATRRGLAQSVCAVLHGAVPFAIISTTRCKARGITPDTGAPFRAPPVPRTLSVRGLSHEPAPGAQNLVALPKKWPQACVWAIVRAAAEG